MRSLILILIKLYQIKAHDIRSVDASLALKGVSLHEILEACFGSIIILLPISI